MSEQSQDRAAARRYLCGNCGVISQPSEWTCWQREDDEDGLGQHWRPSRDDEYDGMMLCPVCAWEHQDDDSGPGVYDGTFSEVDAQRDALLPEFADLWTETLAGALETANHFRDKATERLSLVETAVVELEGALACSEDDAQHWRDHARHAMESALSLCKRATVTNEKPVKHG